MEQEISDNDIDNDDFSDELPFEAEFYRTSTDRDEFVRPIPSPKENEIDKGDDGIELDALSTFVHTPNCTYQIAVRMFFDSIDDLEIKLDGLAMKSDSKDKISLSDFVHQAQLQVFDSIKGKNFTSELMNDIISYLRQAFASAYGFEDNCGVSTSVVTYFTKNDTQVDSPQMNEQTTDIPASSDEDASGDSDPKDLETSSEDDVDDDDSDEVTEEYQSKTLIRPKLSDVIQDAINVYKTLNNWKYPQQA